MVETASPLTGVHDISKTFHLQSLPCYTRIFTSIKDRLRVSLMWVIRIFVSGCVLLDRGGGGTSGG